MLLFQRSDPFPHLAHFLSRRQGELSPTFRSGDLWMRAIGVALMTGGAVAGGIGLLVGMTAALPLFGIAAAGATMSVVGHVLKKPKTPEQIQDEVAAEAIGHLLQLYRQGRLHRHLDQASQQLMEEAARHWARVRNALEGPFWRSPSLPEHYRVARSRAMAAADDAMEDIVVKLRPPERVHRSGEEIWEWVQTLAESLSGPRIPRRMGALPPGFDAARELALRLVELAGEVEGMTQRAIDSDPLRDRLSSARAIEGAIEELHQIRIAESELNR